MARRKRKWDKRIVMRNLRSLQFGDFFKSGSLFLMNGGFYVVTRRRQEIRWHPKKVTNWNGTVRTEYDGERVRILYLKRVLIKGYVEGGTWNLLSPKQQSTFLRYAWNARRGYEE